jgi:ABC-type Fe3+ transport system substrate-binding protein
MRRYVFILLFALTLVTPFVLRHVLGKSSRPGSGADRDHTLLIISPHNEGIRREFRDAFVAWHAARFPNDPPVDVEYNFLGASDIVKYFDDAKRAGAPYRMDIAWGGGDYLFDVQLKKPGYLQPIELPPEVMKLAFPKPDLNGVALYDTAAKEPSWFGAALSSFGILYNKDVLQYLKLPEPRTWRDMADPKYQGWIITADPTRSASARQTFMIIVERAMADAKEQGRSEDDGWADGMGLIRLIASNARLWASSSESVPGVVANGDGAAAMCIDFFARSQVDAIGEQRLGYVEPLGATAINPDPIAVVKDAPHKELAIQFIEFVLSPEGQLLWNSKVGAPGGPKETALRRLPIMPSIYSHAADFTDQVDPYKAAGGFNKSSNREATFTILGELIEFSCMDTLDDLRAAWAAISQSPRAAELDAKLGKFPFDQKEALRRAAEWKKASPRRQLELREQWTRAFRDEYRRLREEALK